MTSLPAERQAQKDLGAFYSPPALVEPMIAWAVTGPSQSILDPSSGDGIFIGTAAKRLLHLGATPAAAARLVHAFDLNPDATRVTREALRSTLGPLEVDVRAASFFSLEPPGTLFSEAAVDVLVGNPPYIRYQAFSGATRTQALGRALESGVKLTRLASSWAHFVAHAIAFIKRGGRLALILPAELIHASYSAPLRRHLRESFEEVHVLSFRSAVFPGAQEEVVLLLAAGKGEPHRRLQLLELESAADLQDLASVLRRAETFYAGVEPAKWVPGYAANPSAACLERLQVEGSYVLLGQIGKANIGFVSGANEFFVLSPEEAASLQLPAASLRPALIRARQIPGISITPRLLAKMREENERCLLWLPGADLTGAEDAYVRHGEALGIARRYKCRMRSPWWVVPGVIVPDAFLTYMSDAVPRLCLNEADAVAANTLHTVRLHGVPQRLRKVFVTAFYNSATLLSCERTGRTYGGGVLKLEPSEADRILVPSVRLVEAHRAALSAASKLVREGLAVGGELMDHAIRAVDAIVLEGADVDEGTVEQLVKARVNSIERRRSRARTGRGHARDEIAEPPSSR
jgi:methylase of polypeptide subunit release factors